MGNDQRVLSDGSEWIEWMADEIWCVDEEPYLRSGHSKMNCVGGRCRLLASSC